MSDEPYDTPKFNVLLASFGVSAAGAGMTSVGLFWLGIAVCYTAAAMTLWRYRPEITSIKLLVTWFRNALGEASLFGFLVSVELFLPSFLIYQHEFQTEKTESLSLNYQIGLSCTQVQQPVIYNKDKKTDLFIVGNETYKSNGSSEDHFLVHSFFSVGGQDASTLRTAPFSLAMCSVTNFGTKPVYRLQITFTLSQYEWVEDQSKRLGAGAMHLTNTLHFKTSDLGNSAAQQNYFYFSNYSKYLVLITWLDDVKVYIPGRLEPIAARLLPSEDPFGKQIYILPGSISTNPPGSLLQARGLQEPPKRK